MIRPINTRYSGYNFRSRTEARWAVFFDCIGWNWQYEREGFHLPSGPYLPDFYFPDFGGWAEVKGKEFTSIEKQKCKELSIDGSIVILLDGLPDFKSYECFSKGEEISNIIFITDGAKYSPLYYGYDFDNDYFKETAEAVRVALSARFEYGETPKIKNYIPNYRKSPKAKVPVLKRREPTDEEIEAMCPDPIKPDPEEWARMVKEVTEINTKLGLDWNGESI